MQILTCGTERASQLTRQSLWLTFRQGHRRVVACLGQALEMAERYDPMLAPSLLPPHRRDRFALDLADTELSDNRMAIATGAVHASAALVIAIASGLQRQLCRTPDPIALLFASVIEVARPRDGGDGPVAQVRRLGGLVGAGASILDRAVAAAERPAFLYANAPHDASEMAPDGASGATGAGPTASIEGFVMQTLRRLLRHCRRHLVLTDHATILEPATAARLRIARLSLLSAAVQAQRRSGTGAVS